MIEARPADRAEVVALWHACGLTRPWNDPERDFDLACNGPSSAILLACDGAALAGSAMVGFDGHRGWVYYLAVDPARRGEGLGRAIMRAAEDWLAAQDISRVRLMVRTGNPAEEFYRRIGYETQEVSTLGRTLDG